MGRTLWARHIWRSEIGVLLPCKNFCQSIIVQLPAYGYANCHFTTFWKYRPSLLVTNKLARWTERSCKACPSCLILQLDLFFTSYQEKLEAPTMPNEAPLDDWIFFRMTCVTAPDGKVTGTVSLIYIGGWSILVLEFCWYCLFGDAIGIFFSWRQNCLKYRWRKYLCLSALLSPQSSLPSASLKYSRCTRVLNTTVVTRALFVLSSRVLHCEECSLDVLLTFLECGGSFSSGYIKTVRRWLSPKSPNVLFINIIRLKKCRITEKSIFNCHLSWICLGNLVAYKRDKIKLTEHIVPMKHNLRKVKSVEA